MNLIPMLQAALLGLVEGLTEFLPVSSTGHLIVVASLIHFVSTNAETFEIAIQSGAMLAVIWEYRGRIGRTLTGLLNDAAARRFTLNLLIAFVPAVIAGLLLGDAIKSRLFRPVPVAIAFAVGGVIILAVERSRRKQDAVPPRIDSVDAIAPFDALRIGLLQCLALIPGTSRSGATIIGGMVLGLSRRAATEFSFYLAIPTLMSAGAWALFKQRHALGAADWPMLAVGTLVSFIVALVVIRWLIRYVTRHDFTLFAWYRIAFGAFILATALTGLVTWSRP